MIWLVIKLLIKLRQFQKIHNRIIQKVTNVHDKEIPKKIPEEKYIYISRRKTKNYY